MKTRIAQDGILSHELMAIVVFRVVDYTSDLQRWVTKLKSHGQDSITTVYARNYATVGSNGKFYIHPNGERAFNGNQYVKTIKLSAIGNGMAKCTGVAGIGFTIYDFGIALKQDYDDYNTYGKTDYYHTAKVFGETIGGSAFGTLGVYSGGTAGSAIAGPVGSIVCGFVFGVGGFLWGEYIGGNVVENYYRANNLFIP